MAYMSQEKKKQIAPKVKAILSRYGVKGTLKVDNHSTLVLNISSGIIDFLENYQEKSKFPVSDYIDVNTYHLEKHFSGKALDFLKEIKAAMNDGNYDNSDPMTDYFNVGWYIDIKIGQWNKPYVYVS